jgi:hypothetical protein
MRRGLFFGLLLVIAATGCNRFAGPLETRQMGPADPKLRGPDGELYPIYNIEQQKLRGRERYAIPEDDYRIGPKLYADRPSPTGR